MKVYGVTVISSEGNCITKQKDGRNVWGESITEIFPGDEKAAVDYAVKAMISNFDACNFEDDKDYNGQTKEDLENALRAKGNVTIQLSDEHISIEMFEKELKISQIEVETPAGKIIAKTKGVKEDYPGIWIFKDNDQPFNMMAAVEYNSSEKRFQIKGYESGTDEPRTMTDYETGEDLIVVRPSYTYDENGNVQTTEGSYDVLLKTHDNQDYDDPIVYKEHKSGKINMSYDYWREHIMDERLEYLDSDEKYEMYLHWKNSHHDKEYT